MIDRLLILFFYRLCYFSFIIDLALKEFFDMFDLIKIEGKSFLIQSFTVGIDGLFELVNLTLHLGDLKLVFVYFAPYEVL